MSANDEKVRLKIRLTEEEKAKLEHGAALCGLTQTDLLRQFCLGKQHRPKPPAEFWALLDALYVWHDTLERLAVRYPEFKPNCQEVEQIILLLSLYKDGKKNNYSKTEQQRLRDTSDRLCREYGLVSLSMAAKPPVAPYGRTSRVESLPTTTSIELICGMLSTVAIPLR